MIRLEITLVKGLSLLTICGVFLLQASCRPEQATEVLPTVEYLTSESTSGRDLPFSEAVRVGRMIFLSGRICV